MEDMKFTVIDTKTGKYPDLEQIALHEDWAKGLMYCDMEGFLIGEDGELILADECGKFAYCPDGRFTVQTETSPEEPNKETETTPICWCTICSHDGHRTSAMCESCVLPLSGKPTNWEPNKETESSQTEPIKEKEKEEAEWVERFRNYCDCCAFRQTEKCDACESGYDGIPSSYRFELAKKSQSEIREEILHQAKICVCTDRKEQYGDAEQSFRCIADMWNAYLKPVYPDIDITPYQAAMMMVLFKAARDAVANVHKIDTHVDMCGYAACAGGMIE